jgi:fluoride exporter
MTALAVILGGGLGAFARYRLEGLIARRQRTPFPLSTLLINVSGSSALGALVGAVTAGRLSPAALPLIGTGFLGGYTTFSTFTYETLRLIEDGAWRYVVWNLLLSGPLSFAGAAITFFVLKGRGA